MENQEENQKPFYSKVWFIILAVLLFIGTIIIISKVSNKEHFSTSEDTPVVVDTTGVEIPKADSTVLETTEAKSNWSYTDDKDKMTNEKRYFASCISTNKIHLDFPPAGDSHITLSVRNMGNGNEIVLQVYKGLFQPYTGEYCRVKFDDGETENYTYNSPAEGNGEVIFVENSSDFLDKLKTANRLMIEAPFHDDGRKIIEFDVEGLIWNL